MPPKFTGLAVIHDVCGRVLGTFHNKKDYQTYKDDEKRFKLYKKTECPQCGQKIIWGQCVKALILETRTDPILKIPKIFFEEVKLSKKDIEDLGKPDKPGKPGGG